MFQLASYFAPATFWLDMSINVMRMKKGNHQQPMLIVAKAQRQHLVLRHQSKHVINVSNRVYLVTDVTLVVSNYTGSIRILLTIIGIAKCISRKCRCTYVKFHRQTAPTGPGHHPRPNAAARLAASHPDDLFLGAPPMSVPSMSATDPYAFNFPQIYGSSDTSQLGISPESGNPDFASRYRAQADLLRRTGGTMVPPTGANGIAALYHDPQAPSSWFGWSQDGSPDPNHMHPGPGGQMQDQSLSNRFLLDDNKTGILEKDMQAAIARHNYDRETAQFNSENGIYSNGMYGRHRSGSLDLGSDSGSNTHSVPSSAASSSIHLPLDGGPAPHQMYHVGTEDLQQFPELILSEQDINHNRGPGGGVQYPMSHDLRHSSSHPNLHNEGGFSSAFGLMSIDDPNVMAGLQADGPQFFSNAAMNMAPTADPNATPMPKALRERGSQMVSASLPTPGLAREAETRELRDFWKQYIHTPLTGPGPSALDAAGLLPPGSRLPTSPNGSRRARVNSLPSAKTPTADLAEYVNGSQQGVNPSAKGVNGTSSMRTTLHGNPDDLRSYEAAVLARKAPTLNFPKKSRGSASSASPPNPPNRGITIPGAAGVNGGNYALSRPSSSNSGGSSSLAFALDQGGSPVNMPRAKVSMAPPPGAAFSSRESSVSEEPASDRPSFKRLPSQTLEPANSKRAFLSTGAEDEEDVGLMNGVGVGISKSLQNGLQGSLNGGPPRPMVNLSQHRRQISNPASLVPSIATFNSAGTAAQELGEAA